jgi:hypothetical protein
MFDICIYRVYRKREKKISIKDHHANGIRLDKEDIHNNSFPICRNVLRQQTGITSTHQRISNLFQCNNTEQNKIENVIF